MWGMTAIDFSSAWISLAGLDDVLTDLHVDSNLRVQGHSCDAHTLPGVPRDDSGSAQSHIPHSTAGYGWTRCSLTPLRLPGCVRNVPYLLTWYKSFRARNSVVPHLRRRHHDTI